MQVELGHSSSRFLRFLERSRNEATVLESRGLRVAFSIFPVSLAEFAMIAQLAFPFIHIFPLGT